MSNLSPWKKRVRLAILTVSVLSTLVIAGCSKDEEGKKDPKKSGSAPSGTELRSIAQQTNQLLVLDETDEPVSATLQFGNPQTTLNTFQTNSQGLMPVPVVWTSALDVKISAAGYVTRIYPGCSPGAFVFQLRHQGLASQSKHP